MECWWWRGGGRSGSQGLSSCLQASGTGSRDWVVVISPEMALEMMPHETLQCGWAGCSLMQFQVACALPDPNGSLPLILLIHPVFHPRCGRLLSPGGANRPPVRADHRLFLSRSVV